MKLRLMFSDSSYNSRTLCLCDDDGNPLPMQTHVEVVNDINEPTRIRVEFVVDGEFVQLGPK